MTGPVNTDTNEADSRIDRVVSFVNRATAQVAHAMLWLLSLVVLYDVGMRSLGAPPIWGAEVSVYLMIAVAFLGAGYTSAQGGHFRVTALVGLLPTWGQRACHVTCTSLALVFTVLFTVGAYRLAAFSFELNFTTPTVLKMPVGVLQGIVFIGGIFLTLALAHELWLAITGRADQPKDAAVAVE